MVCKTQLQAAIRDVAKKYTFFATSPSDCVQNLVTNYK